MPDKSNKGALDAPETPAETRKRAEASGVYTKSEDKRAKRGRQGPTGQTGATGPGTSPKLGSGNKPTEASTGTSASPQPREDEELAGGARQL